MGIENAMKNKDDSNGPNGRTFTLKKTEGSKTERLIIPMSRAG